MARVTDVDGVWEVTEGVGCINKCLAEPSEQYLAEHPEYGTPSEPSLESRVSGVEDAVMAIIDMMG